MSNDNNTLEPLTEKQAFDYATAMIICRGVNGYAKVPTPLKWEITQPTQLINANEENKDA